MHVGTAFDLYITSYDFYGESKQGASLSVSILFCKGSERVLTVKNADLFINETDYADLDMEDADAHLSSALRFRTTSYIDTSRIDYAQFTAFHDFLKRTYPHVLSASEWEEIGYSLLIRIPGSDPSLKPALFMAHQDVVPVVPGTEQDWLHDPFSGDIADGFIWGRGAMDIKEMLIGILESAEYLLSHGRQFRRSVYLAFGEDEETVSVGAVAICKTLEKRGVELEYVLDESSADVLDAADYGAPGTLVCTVGTYEKGYADMKLTACSRGGHSSNPFRGPSLQTLAKAITAITEHPTKPHLSDAIRSALNTLRPKITEEPMKTWVQDIDAHEEEIIQWFLSKEGLYHQVRTTAAPTQIDPGSPAGNVMPQNMSAVINFRLAPPDTPKSLLQHCREVTNGEVELSYVQEIEASRPSDTNALGYRSLTAAAGHYFDRVIFIPVQNRGATDARRYEPVCRCCLRFGPFLEEEAISAEGIHGTNERISLRAYHQGIRVLVRMMESTCCLERV